jgi:hypothetical protein
MGTVAMFLPTHFDVSKLEVLANTFEEIFYVDDAQYKKVEIIVDGQDFFKPRERHCYRNDIEIAEFEYEEALTDDIHLLLRNHIAFLENNKVCDLFIYHLQDESLKFVVEVDFFSEAERESFIRPYWFGKEVDGKYNSDLAIWQYIK